MSWQRRSERNWSCVTWRYDKDPSVDGAYRQVRQPNALQTFTLLDILKNLALMP